MNIKNVGKRLANLGQGAAEIAKKGVVGAIGAGVDAVRPAFEASKKVPAQVEALRSAIAGTGLPTNPSDALGAAASGIGGLWDQFGDSVNQIGGTGPLKDNLEALGVPTGFIPRTPGAGEIVGGAAGALGGGIGAGVANVANPVANAIQGRPLFQDQQKAIRDLASSTAGFGNRAGREGTRAAIMSDAGKLASGAMALPSIKGVVDDVESGNVGVGTGLKAGAAALGLYGAAKQPNWTPGGILDDMLPKGAVPGAGTTQAVDGPQLGKWSDAYNRKMDSSFWDPKTNSYKGISSRMPDERFMEYGTNRGVGAVSVPKLTSAQQGAVTKLSNGFIDPQAATEGANRYLESNPLRGIASKTDARGNAAFLKGYVANMVSGGETDPAKIVKAIGDSQISRAYGDGLKAQVTKIIRGFAK